MKVVLVNPRMTSGSSVRLPLSILALGAVLDGRHEYALVDGNVEPDAAGAVARALDGAGEAVVGVTVMPGPQVRPAIELSRAVRRARPDVPIVWGGYFPTLYPDAALNAAYVDYLVRGQGEVTLLELLGALGEAGAPRSDPDGAPDGAAADSAEHPEALAGLAGLSYRSGGRIVHNADRPLAPPGAFPALPYGRLGDVEGYLQPTFLGRRTAVHQAAIGCRYRCTFCGVVSMFDGATLEDEPARLARAIETLRGYGADALQFYDHNFFDREASSVEILEVLARYRIPWWCYARADTMAGFRPSTWRLLEKSRLKMAYIGAEAASDAVLAGMKKGTRVEHTLEVARLCREHGVVPEFSFVLGGPNDPEAEIEATLVFIRRLKRIHPECEVVTYFYSPTPQRDREARRAARSGGGGREALPLLQSYGPEGPALPTTPEEWTEPEWLDFVCHRDAPWLSDRVRRRVRDFSLVLSSRFPTVQDVTTPRWGKRVLRALAGWRYAARLYDHPWELGLARRMIPLRQPEAQGL